MVYQLLCICEREKRIWLTLFPYALYVLQNQRKISNFRPLHTPAKKLNLTFVEMNSLTYFFSHPPPLARSSLCSTSTPPTIDDGQHRIHR